MAALTLNLYPPVLDTYMPAFVIDGNNTECKVYFNLSDYNSIENIANAQVLVTNQYNNLTVLNNNLYPSEIAIKTIQEDNNGYYILIENTDIQDGFINDINYKVQIRFTSTEASELPAFIDGKQAISTWLTENLDYFSEWSRACLIYGISKPDIVAYYNKIEEGTSTKTRWEPEVSIDWSQSATVTFIGNLVYADSAETEYIQSYYINLYNSNNQLIESSGNIYPNSNVIEYIFKARLTQGDDYYFRVNYTTISQYNEDVEFDFVIIGVTPGALQGIFEAEPDDEHGLIKLHFTNQTDGNAATKLAIRRGSSKDNFTFEEDLITEENFVLSESLGLTYWDKTIESGIFYQYSIQIINNDGFVGTPILTDKVLVSSEYAYINSEDRQVTLKYDSTVSSLKKVLTESITNTLGSQYPFIRRNGDVAYYQFPITGLITYNQDDWNLFTSLNEIYQDSYDIHDAYNSNHNIQDYRDYNYEKLYRQKLYDFLTDGQIKLFRGPAEGNFLVKLTDVSLTPNQQLGRMIWSFSATATEIDKYTLENLKKYNLLNINYPTNIPEELDIQDSLYTGTNN